MLRPSEEILDLVFIDFDVSEHVVLRESDGYKLCTPETDFGSSEIFLASHPFWTTYYCEGWASSDFAQVSLQEKMGDVERDVALRKIDIKSRLMDDVLYSKQVMNEFDFLLEAGRRDVPLIITVPLHRPIIETQTHFLVSRNFHSSYNFFLKSLPERMGRHVYVLPTIINQLNEDHGVSTGAIDMGFSTTCLKPSGDILAPFSEKKIYVGGEYLSSCAMKTVRDLSDVDCSLELMLQYMPEFSRDDSFSIDSDQYMVGDQENVSVFEHVDFEFSKLDPDKVNSHLNRYAHTGFKIQNLAGPQYLKINRDRIQLNVGMF